MPTADSTHGARRTRPADPRHDRARVKIFCGNIPFGTTEPELRRHFEIYGPIDDVRIALDGNRMPSIAFVTFKRERDERAAIVRLNGEPFEDRYLDVFAHRQ